MSEKLPEWLKDAANNKREFQNLAKLGLYVLWAVAKEDSKELEVTKDLCKRMRSSHDSVVKMIESFEKKSTKKKRITKHITPDRAVEIALTISPEFERPNLAQALREWVEYKVESKHAWKTEAAVKAQVRKFVGYEDYLIDSINEAMSREWKGLFIPKDAEKQRPLEDYSLAEIQSHEKELFGHVYTPSLGESK